MADPQFSYAQALNLTLTQVSPLGSECVPLAHLTGRIAAEDLFAKADSPSADVSFKDGYAVRSEDVAGAAPDHPVCLRILDHMAEAGGKQAGEIEPGSAMRILSGARLPIGTRAVVSEEFTHQEGGRLIILADAEPGRNVLARGSDIAIGQRLISAGDVIQPAQVGLLAAAGHSQAQVYRHPHVGILSTGTEVIAPGAPLEEGKLFASNLVTLSAWCSYYGMQVSTEVVRDDAELIRSRLQGLIRDCDAVLTSGGAWSGDRDYVVRLLDELGWDKAYHRVRIGPGKAIGFGLLLGKPVFCLPGGPPSNYMAFIHLALPGLLRLAGSRRPSLPVLSASLTETVRGQVDWTQFVPGRLEWRANFMYFKPLKMLGRLHMLADAQAVLSIPEGQAAIREGTPVTVTVLGWPDQEG
jgi:molybdopterin molybdotransferase